MATDEHTKSELLDNVTLDIVVRGRYYYYPEIWMTANMSNKQADYRRSFS